MAGNSQKLVGGVTFPKRNFANLWGPSPLKRTSLGSDKVSWLFLERGSIVQYDICHNFLLSIFIVTPWKFNSSPLKNIPGPTKERIVFLCHHFSGVNSLLNFGGVSI